MARCPECNKEISSHGLCFSCQSKQNKKTRHTRFSAHPASAANRAPLLSIVRGVFVTLAFLLVLGTALMLFFDSFFTPVRKIKVALFGQSATLSIARNESNYYFWKYGEKLEVTESDLMALQNDFLQNKEYKIKLTEQYSHTKLPADAGKTSETLTIKQHIRVDYSNNVIKIDVKPETVYHSENNQKAIGTLFEDYTLLPFGTYYIAEFDGETYILSDTGNGTSSKTIEDRTKQAVKKTDNQLLFQKLQSYLIENIVDFETLFAEGAECYELYGIKEYSVPTYADRKGIEWRQKYLREVNGAPAAYWFDCQEEIEDISRTNRSIRADFFYSATYKNKPSLNDYTQEE